MLFVHILLHWTSLYQQAVVAEWLRRLTRNQLGSARAGSNPADCELLFLKFFIACQLTISSLIVSVVIVSFYRWFSH